MELRAGSNDPAIMKYLSELLDIIESGKAEVDAITSAKEAHLRDFADRVFSVAEGEYQSGGATKNTARSFLHASVFYEALKHFSPLTEEILGLIRYSKWKATEIMTAITEGRVPGPDGASERQLDEEMNGHAAPEVPEVPSFGNMSYAAPATTVVPQRPVSSPKPLSDSGDLDLPDVPVFSQSQLNAQNRSSGLGAGMSANSRPTSQPQPPSFQAPQHTGFNHSTHSSAPMHSQAPLQQDASLGSPNGHSAAAPLGASSAPKSNQAFNNFISSRVVIAPKSTPANIDVILEATKFSKNAISALQFDDPETAIKNLRAALRILTGSDQ